MSKIKSITAREILDSRGNPTVEVEVLLASGRQAWAGVPSGASTGSHEALELRDGDKRRYQGQGVLKAVSNVNKKIASKLVGLDPKNQKQIDELMLKLDGTENKSNLGANAILGVSLAVARAAAIDCQKPLYLYLRQKFWSKNKSRLFPTLMVNIFNGGRHADTNLDMQEFMILPKQKNIKEAIRCGAEIFHALGDVLKMAGLDTDVGNEGGYAPNVGRTTQAISFILRAVKKAGYQAGKDVFLGLDVAASEFFDRESKKYIFKTDKKKLNQTEMIEMFSDWLIKYPLISVEDPLEQDDWRGWQKLTKRLGKKVMLVGDDLFVTNIKRLKEGIKYKVANAILIKLNQIGSLTETIDCIKLAQKNKYKVAVSHRSGETIDDFIADLAVASGAEYIKTGSLSRGERIAKYNRLMEIWDELN